MVIRRVVNTRALAPASSALRRLNARHPWSHNDYFHPWVLTRLPRYRRSALDVGCGRGEFAAALAPHFASVEATDIDPAMRAAAGKRAAGLSNVSVTNSELARYDDRQFDLVTMVAVLHQLDVGRAVTEVARILAPGGKFLVVGLAPPRSILDQVWDVASMVTNPIIGYVHHPWPSAEGVQPPPFPVADPALSIAELQQLIHPVMPRAIFIRHLAFRHTIEWTKPFL